MKIIVLLTLVVLLADMYPAAPAVDKKNEQASRSTTPPTTAKTGRTPVTGLPRATTTKALKSSSTPTRKPRTKLPVKVMPTMPSALKVLYSSVCRIVDTASNTTMNQIPCPNNENCLRSIRLNATTKAFFCTPRRPTVVVKPK